MHGLSAAAVYMQRSQQLCDAFHPCLPSGMQKLSPAKTRKTYATKQQQPHMSAAAASGSSTSLQDRPAKQQGQPQAQPPALTRVKQVCCFHIKACRTPHSARVSVTKFSVSSCKPCSDCMSCECAAVVLGCPCPAVRQALQCGACCSHDAWLLVPAGACCACVGCDLA
jgi:hypothetical protein